MEEELELLSTQLKSVLQRYMNLVEKTFNEKLKAYKPTYLTPIGIELQPGRHTYYYIKDFGGEILGEIKLTDKGICYCIESEYQRLFEECL